MLGVAILVPALITLKLDPFVAHMFVIYFASLAHLTPPVCATVFLASGIAHSKWVKTGFLACMIALPAFVVPYTFAYNPAMLMMGSWYNIIVSTVTALVGVFFIGVATAGYVRREIPMLFRIPMVVGGIMLLVPDLVTSLIGLVVCLVPYLICQFFLKGSNTANA